VRTKTPVVWKPRRKCRSLTHKNRGVVAERTEQATVEEAPSTDDTRTRVVNRQLYVAKSVTLQASRV